MIRGLALAMVVVAGPASAQDWVDYELVMQQHAGRVVTETADGQTTRRLDMGDGVMITCFDDGCVGMDLDGANGCFMAIIAELAALARLCRAEVGAATADALLALYDQAGALVAPNAVPPLDWDSVGPAALEQAVASFGEELDCASVPDDPSLVAMIQGVADPAAQSELRMLLSRPRLPVMNPCL